MGRTDKTKPSEIEKRLALGDQIEAVNSVKNKNKSKRRFRHDEDEQFVNADISKKILKTALKQKQDELDDDVIKPAKRVKFPLPIKDNDNDSESDVDDLEPDTYYQNFDVNEEEEEVFQEFFIKKPKKIQSINDLLAEKKAEADSQCSDVDTLRLQDIDPRIRTMYEGVGDVLKKYRSGKLPKAFKMIPHLQNWEQILHLTDPHSWSAAAMYQATRIFASNLKEKMAQRFYNLVLLCRIRDDIAEHKRLNFHLYQSLRKALFKPGAFMKGILLPLLEAGDCTLREAIIIGSVLSRNSVPVLHSGAALLKIAEMAYTGASSIFLRIFLDKKYALPYRVVDAIVFHFLRFDRDHRVMPVLWHQAFLTFVQRYKSDISIEQRDALLQLLRKHTHVTITPEIRRELQAAECRDVQEATSADTEMMTE